jgi:hypothetical protein
MQSSLVLPSATERPEATLLSVLVSPRAMTEWQSGHSRWQGPSRATTGPEVQMHRSERRGARLRARSLNRQTGPSKTCETDPYKNLVARQLAILALDLLRTLRLRKAAVQQEVGRGTRDAAPQMCKPRHCGGVYGLVAASCRAARAS